jgi:hypothetical protein
MCIRAYHIVIFPTNLTCQLLVFFFSHVRVYLTHIWTFPFLPYVLVIFPYAIVIYIYIHISLLCCSPVL